MSRHLTQPLLAVRNRVHGRDANIVIAADLSRSLFHLVDTAKRFFPHRALTLYHACRHPVSTFADTTSTVAALAYHRAVTASDPCPADCALPTTEDEHLQVVIEGKPLSLSLSSYVRRHEIDLVVAGTRFRTRLSACLLGMTTDGLLHGIPCDAPFGARCATRHLH